MVIVEFIDLAKIDGQTNKQTNKQTRERFSVKKHSCVC